MGRSRALSSAVALGAALALVLGGGTAAFADQLAIDGDGLAPVAGPAGQAASVEACTDQAVEFTVLIAARRNGGPNVTFANGSSVEVAFSSASAGMTASLHDDVISLPANWAGLASNTLSSDTIAATITLPAQTGPGSGTVTFSFSGTNVNGADYDRSNNDLAVSWTTSQCVTDTTPPVLTLPADMVVEASGADGAAVEYSAVATDETAPPDPAVTCAPPAGAVFPLGSTTVNCSATDAAGNLANGSFTIDVVDTTAPEVGSVSDVAFEATGALTVVTWVDPTATDVVDAGVPVTCAPGSGTGFAVGVTAVTCTATDAAGNTGSSSFSVTISDTTAPSLMLPTLLVAEADGPSGAPVSFSASASDIVDGSIPVTCDAASGAVFPLGDTAVECSATDAAGNTAAGSFTVRVQDTTPPAVTVPDAITAEATGPSGAVVTFSASAADLVDGALPVTCVPASGSTFAVDTVEVDCSATDAAGNTGSASFFVTVADTTAPTITLPALPIEVEATGPSGAVVGYTVTASDIVDGSVAVSCDPASGSTFAVATTQVDCTAADAAGNEATAAFAVTVQDTSPPVITWAGGPADGASYVYGSVPAAGSCTAVDLVDLSVSCTVSGYAATVGSQTLTAHAEDSRGNGTTETRSYTVEAWTLSGFHQPVDAGVWNTVKGGSTVPLKFEVFAGDAELTDTSAVARFSVVSVSCATAALGADEIELTTTGKTALRYDMTEGQFLQNWQTPKSPGLCYTVIMTTQDGSSISALFKLK